MSDEPLPCDARQEHILSFPPGRSLGKLFVRDHGQPASASWRELGEARGDVAVPPGSAVYLCVSADGAGDLSPLTLLQPEALHRLELSGTTVTDSELSHLRGLIGLRELELSNTAITDAGLGHLQGLTGLRELYLAHGRITDAGLVDLRGLTGLRCLDLGGTRITDAGLVHLAALTGLERLYLNGTSITDAGLMRLHTLTGLRDLQVEETQITDAGITRFKEALPDCLVLRDRDMGDGAAVHGDAYVERRGGPPGA